ncbi:hypothetical protein Gotur_008829 [Gossypium turneri]
MLGFILMMNIRLCYYCALYLIHTIETKSTVSLVWIARQIGKLPFW